MYKATFDRVAQLFSRDSYAGEFNVAREDYFRRTGKVFEDDPMFEVRMSGFLEWYLLDRLLWDSGIPPVRLYRLKYGETLEGREVDVLGGLEGSVHSLFRLEGRDRQGYVVQDLRRAEKHKVSERHAVPGVHRGDILDARMVRIADETFFSHALWIHPSDASHFLETESRKKRGGPIEEWHAFLFDLAYMKLKRERYAHVPTDQIYDWTAFARDRAETDRRSSDHLAGAAG